MIAVKFSDQTLDAQFNSAVGDFVSNIVFGKPGRFENFASMAVFDGKRVIAGVLYNNWHPDNGVIELHAGAIDKRWMTRPVLQEMFAHVFDRFKCQLCVIQVSDKNPAMLRIAKGLGFKGPCVPRLRGREEAGHILTLADDDWRASRLNRGR